MTQNETTSARDWSAIGLDWTTEGVSEVFGENNQSDKRIVNAKAQMPVVTDLAKFRDHFGDDCFLGWLNSSNSLRVRAQSIGRKHKASLGIEANREAVYNAIRGVRNAPVRSAPFDRAAFIGTYTAALIDKGIDAALARQLADSAAAMIRQ